jgi:type II secretory pathway component PulK
MNAGRRGTALLLALALLLFLELLLAGIAWTVRAHARAGVEALAVVRAAAGADAALVAARDWLEAAPVESLPAAVAGMPPPIRLPGSTMAYAQLDQVDSTLVEVVAQGFSGRNGVGARRQRCLLVQVAIAGDSAARRIRTVLVPERPLTNC